MREAELNRYLNAEQSELECQMQHKAVEKVQSIINQLQEAIECDLGQYMEEDEFQSLQEQLDDLSYEVNRVAPDA